MAKTTLQLQQGRLLVQEYDSAGNLVGDLVRFGTTDTVTLNTDVSKLEHYNTEGETGIPALDGNHVTQQKTTINVTTSDITNANLARANFAGITEVTQASETAATYTVASSSLGAIYDIGKRNISAVTVTDTGAVTTYTEGVDYEYSKTWGTIEFLESGSIVEASETIVTYDAAATTSYAFAGLENTSKEYKLIFEGIATAGTSQKYVFPKVALAITGDQTLKSETQAYTALNFEGALYGDYTIETA